MKTLMTLLQEKTGLSEDTIKNIIELIKEGNTIPFIARYRKEMTWWATDTQLRDFEEVYNYQQKLLERKVDIIRLLEEKEIITDELRDAVARAQTLSALEDIYRPFKDKKNTRATKAITKGLQPLADLLLACELSIDEFNNKAKEFITDTWDVKTTVSSLEEAILGAQDIVAEIVADDPNLRSTIRENQSNTVSLWTAPTKKFEDNSVYEIYKDYTKPIKNIPSYAYLAISRAEKEKQLRVKVSFDEAKSIWEWKKSFIPQWSSNLETILWDAIIDGIKRLLHPSLEREYRSDKNAQSDREAIEIFGKNVWELLLSSPVRNKVIMWFDPAYRTWCKIAIIDETGKYLESTVVYPTDPQNDLVWATSTLLALIKKYSIGLICIGNWTASRESESFVAQLIKDNNLDTKYLVVSEAWASVYSASKLANEEYPDLDVTVRGAINIAQRVQDPLATYVKIDPKSLGVWQYQHDVDQKLLKEKLDNYIEDSVNRVWVDINTASWALLQHIAWLSTTMAKNMVTWREENGTFTGRTQIKKVKWLGPKAFEQCAWFLRINAAKEQLDSTWVHPESYKITYEILEKECWVKKKKLVLPFEFPKEKSLSSIAQQYNIWQETLQDIVKELANPWLDPREEFNEAWFKSDVLTIDDLKVWMKLQWIVRNIVDFGAFVDIGLKNDWLVHKSQLSDTYISNPFDAVSIWQQIQVTVLEVDMNRKRVSLSAKTWTATAKNVVKKSPRKAQQKKVVKEEPTQLKGNINFS